MFAQGEHEAEEHVAERVPDPGGTAADLGDSDENPGTPPYIQQSGTYKQPLC